MAEGEKIFEQAGQVIWHMRGFSAKINGRVPAAVWNELLTLQADFEVFVQKARQKQELEEQLDLLEIAKEVLLEYQLALDYFKNSRFWPMVENLFKENQAFIELLPE